jgi:hypothetical protein
VIELETVDDMEMLDAALVTACDTRWKSPTCCGRGGGSSRGGNSKWQCSTSTHPWVFHSHFAIDPRKKSNLQPLVAERPVLSGDKDCWIKSEARTGSWDRRGPMGLVNLLSN